MVYDHENARTTLDTFIHVPLQAFRLEVENAAAGSGLLIDAQNFVATHGDPKAEVPVDEVYTIMNNALGITILRAIDMYSGLPLPVDASQAKLVKNFAEQEIKRGLKPVEDIVLITQPANEKIRVRELSVEKFLRMILDLNILMRQRAVLEADKAAAVGAVPPDPDEVDRLDQELAKNENSQRLLLISLDCHPAKNVLEPFTVIVDGLKATIVGFEDPYFRVPAPEAADYDLGPAQPAFEEYVKLFTFSKSTYLDANLRTFASSVSYKSPDFFHSLVLVIRGYEGNVPGSLAPIYNDFITLLLTKLEDFSRLLPADKATVRASEGIPGGDTELNQIIALLRKVKADLNGEGDLQIRIENLAKEAAQNTVKLYLVSGMNLNEARIYIENQGIDDPLERAIFNAEQALEGLMREPELAWMPLEQRNLFLPVYIQVVQDYKNQVSALREVKSSQRIDFVAPTLGTEEAWMAAFADAFAGKDEEVIFDWLSKFKADLEQAEAKHDEQSRLKSGVDGRKFEALKKVLENRAENNPAEPRYEYYRVYFSARLAFADLSGPFIASDRITGDFFEGVVKQYPNMERSYFDFFLGSSTEEEWKRYEHAEVVRFILPEMKQLFMDQYDYMNSPSDPNAPGYFCLGRMSWMAGNAGVPMREYIGLLKRKITAQFPGLDETQIKEIVRIAYLIFAFTGGREEVYVGMFAGVGISPPSMAQLSLFYELTPLAKDMNLACKKVVAIPDVVFGKKISKQWLLKMATRIGLYTLLEEADRAGTLDDILHHYSPGGTSYQSNRLWGISGMPDLGPTTDVTTYDSHIEALSDDQIDELFKAIRDSHWISTNNAFTRFRNLLRSIEYSEALSNGIQYYERDIEGDATRNGVELQLLDADGALDPDGLILAPTMATPAQYTWGATELQERHDGAYESGYFSGYDFHDAYKRAFEATQKLNEHVKKDVPKISAEKTEHAREEGIIAITTDLFKMLAITSPLKAEVRAMNWVQIVEFYKRRLHQLLAAYIDKQGDPAIKVTRDLWGSVQEAYRVASEGLHESTGGAADIRLPIPFRPIHSLIESIQVVVQTSGQTMGANGEEIWYQSALDRYAGARPSKTKYVSPETVAGGSRKSMKETLLGLLLEDGVPITAEVRTMIDDGINKGHYESKQRHFWVKSLLQLAFRGMRQDSTALRKIYDLERAWEIEEKTLSKSLLPVGAETVRNEQKDEIAKAEEAGKAKSAA